MIDKHTLRNMLSYLDKESFTEFIFQLWQEDANEDQNHHELRKLTNIGSGILEQCITQLDNQKDRTNFYNLIIPFYEPVELWKDPKRINFVDHPILEPAIRKYKRYFSRRLKAYNIFSHGELGIPVIAYVSNTAGFSEDYYQEFVLPGLEELTQHVGFYAQTKFGNCDSFVNLSYDKTLKVFQQFSENRKSLSISINDEHPRVSEYLAQRHFASGVLNDTPLQPVLSKTEINETLKEFESLLRLPVQENQLEKFIKKHYKLLFGAQYDRVEAQLWMKFPELDIGHQNRRIDVFLRNAVERDWELLELKQINKPVKIVQGLPNFSSRIYSAIEQLKNYGKLLEQSAIKEKFKRMGIEYFSPELKLVIDKRPDISTEQWRWLKQRNENGFKILTMEDLFKEVKMRTGAAMDL